MNTLIDPFDGKKINTIISHSTPEIIYDIVSALAKIECPFNFYENNDSWKEVFIIACKKRNVQVIKMFPLEEYAEIGFKISATTNSKSLVQLFLPHVKTMQNEIFLETVINQYFQISIELICNNNVNESGIIKAYKIMYFIKSGSNDFKEFIEFLIKLMKTNNIKIPKITKDVINEELETCTNQILLRHIILHFIKNKQKCDFNEKVSNNIANFEYDGSFGFIIFNTNVTYIARKHIFLQICEHGNDSMINNFFNKWSINDEELVTGFSIAIKKKKIEIAKIIFDRYTKNLKIHDVFFENIEDNDLIKHIFEKAEIIVLTESQTKKRALMACRYKNPDLVMHVARNIQLKNEANDLLYECRYGYVCKVLFKFCLNKKISITYRTCEKILGVICSEGDSDCDDIYKYLMDLRRFFDVSFDRILVECCKGSNMKMIKKIFDECQRMDDDLMFEAFVSSQCDETTYKFVCSRYIGVRIIDQIYEYIFMKMCRYGTIVDITKTLVTLKNNKIDTNIGSAIKQALKYKRYDVVNFLLSTEPTGESCDIYELHMKYMKFVICEKN